MLLSLLCGAVLLQDAPPGDEDARAALKKLAEQFREARTLSAKVGQERRTELLDQPIRSSGTMIYRREPARLVFRMSEPKRTEIHLDRTSYQVHRPDEKRLERFEFEDEALSGRLLMIFEPKPEELGKTFLPTTVAKREGEIDVRLEPRDEKVRGHLKKLVLTVALPGGMLRRIEYVDGEGDEIRFDLAEVAVNPALAPESFELKVPEGTRVLRHKAKVPK